MSDKKQHVGRWESPRFGLRKLSEMPPAPARTQSEAMDVLLGELKGLRQHHGVARLVEACETLRDWPTAAVLWKGMSPSTPARGASLAQAVEPYLEDIKRCEARVNWDALGLKGEKPSAVLEGRMQAWQSPPSRGRG